MGSACQMQAWQHAPEISQPMLLWSIVVQKAFRAGQSGCGLYIDQPVAGEVCESLASAHERSEGHME